MLYLFYQLILCGLTGNCLSLKKKQYCGVKFLFFLFHLFEFFLEQL